MADRDLFTKNARLLKGASPAARANADPVDSRTGLFDPLLTALAEKHSGDLPDVVAIHGLLGEAPDGSYRMYLSKSLDEYVQFPAEAAVAWAPRPDGWGVIVWVERTAMLRHVTSSTRHAQELFLDGPLAQDYLPTADTSVAGAWAGFPVGKSNQGGLCSP